jgi:CIC family chloride channel protein
MVGAAAMFAGVARAPLTGIILIVELTQTYSLIAPVIIAAFTSSEVLKLMSRETIYTEKLKRKGVDILRLTSSKLATGVSVGDIMTEEPITVTVDETLGEVREKFRHTRQHGFPVLNNAGKLHGIVTLSDIEGYSENSDSAETRRARGVNDGSPVTKVCTTSLITAFPDETITEVLPRIFDYQLGQVLIVDPDDPKLLLGLLLDRNLIKAWKLAYRHGEHSILSAYHMREREGESDGEDAGESNGDTRG